MSAQHQGTAGLKFAPCPHNTGAPPEYCRKTPLHPRTPARLLHVIASLQTQKRPRLLHVIAKHALANADTPPSLTCHCEPVRTLAWQSVSPCSSAKREAAPKANPQPSTNSPKPQPTCQVFLQGYGLPRRFAPRNDMLKLAGCPHSTRVLPG